MKTFHTIQKKMRRYIVKDIIKEISKAHSTLR